MDEASKELAKAVLRDDDSAVRPLIDHLLEVLQLTHVPPLKKIECDLDNLRAVFRTYPQLGGDILVDTETLREHYRQWLEEGRPMMLMGMTVEFYELNIRR